MAASSSVRISSRRSGSHRNGGPWSPRSTAYGLIRHDVYDSSSSRGTTHSRSTTPPDHACDASNVSGAGQASCLTRKYVIPVPLIFCRDT
jgi:hypothetical protein